MHRVSHSARGRQNENCHRATLRRALDRVGAQLVEAATFRSLTRLPSSPDRANLQIARARLGEKAPTGSSRALLVALDQIAQVLAASELVAIKRAARHIWARKLGALTSVARAFLLCHRDVAVANCNCSSAWAKPSRVEPS